MESGPSGPGLTGTDDEVLIQALRNLWTILSREARRQAIKTARKVDGD